MFRLPTPYLTLVAGFVMLAGLLTNDPSVAQFQQPAAVAPLPPDHELDAMLAARKWSDLGAALSHVRSGESVLRMMNWLQSRIDTGGGFLLGFVLAKNLWELGNARKNDDPNADNRITAGLITLYTYELIAIDGAKCGDKTAPDHRLQQLLMTNGPALAYLKTKPDAIKVSVVEIAIALEKKTAPLRKLDDLLCRDGLEQMQAGIVAGTTHDVQSPGQYGRTVAVEAPKDFAPRVLLPGQYEPAQESARLKMKGNLLKLLQ